MVEHAAERKSGDMILEAWILFLLSVAAIVVGKIVRRRIRLMEDLAELKRLNGVMKKQADGLKTLGDVMGRLHYQIADEQDGDRDAGVVRFDIVDKP